MKRLTYLALTVSITLSLCLMGQDCFATQWAKSYGGSDLGSVESIQQTSDGGYLVVGNTQSFAAGSWDMWILKLDQNGNISWQKTYGESLTQVAEIYLHSIGDAEREAMKIFEQISEKSHTDSHIEQNTTKLLDNLR